MEFRNISWSIWRRGLVCLLLFTPWAVVQGLQPVPGALPELPELPGIPDFNPVCDWREGQPHKMHWPQRPDLTPQAVDVDMRAHLADDFRCTQTGPITDVHIWGGFLQDFIAAGGPGSLIFELSIYADIPATSDRWSRPGQRLWQQNFSPGDYNWRAVSDEAVGWFEPISDTYIPNDHYRTLQFNFCIEEDPFIQKEGTIYWLGVRVLTNTATSAFTALGWRSALPQLQWNDAAVFQGGGQWLPLTYPKGHEYEGKLLDLAFVITGNPDPPPGKDLGDAPDSTNSWANTVMTAYPVGPVPARYPTVHVAGSPPHGPLHHNPVGLAFLGNLVTFEVEADLGPDTDTTNNILPQFDAPNRDGADDSIDLPLVLPPCEKTTFDYDVTVVSLAQSVVFVNVWFDWNRDGDWNDRVDCDSGEIVSEWAVQNQTIPIAALGTFTHTTPAFLSWHPLSQDERNPLWMRITLSERPWDAANFVHGGAGPSSGYKFGETEDYLLYPRLTPHDDIYDWGDAPDKTQAPMYPTLLAHNGAHHVAEGPWFGDAADMPDTEPDGQPEVNAKGDDLDLSFPLLGVNDDEDGVSVPPLVPGQVGDITLEVNGGGGYVDAWIDFNGDGSWTAAEQIYGGFLPDGLHVISIT
ncbi:GEVED domain-containing protein, partial [Planctomycetota bacterium]